LAVCASPISSRCSVWASAVMSTHGQYAVVGLSSKSSDPLGEGFGHIVLCPWGAPAVRRILGRLIVQRSHATAKPSNRSPWKCCRALARVSSAKATVERRTTRSGGIEAAPPPSLSWVVPLQCAAVGRIRRGAGVPCDRQCRPGRPREIPRPACGGWSAWPAAIDTPSCAGEVSARDPASARDRGTRGAR
jgi:hypothetical protein